MSFEEPRYLHCAWLLPLLVAGYWLSRTLTARTLRAGGYPELRLPTHNQLGYRLRLALRLLALAALVLALAAPQRAAPAPARPPGATRLVFVVDVSRSMLATDVLPDRLSLAQKVVAEVARGLHGQEAALVVFAGNAQLYTPLTTDYESLARACATLSPALVPRQGTSLAAALSLAAQVFGGPAAGQGRAICVLSDGESHAPGYDVLADSLRKAGIQLFAVGIGTPAGGTLLVPGRPGEPPAPKRDRDGQPVHSRLREDNLQRLVPGQPGRYIGLDTWRNAAARLAAQIEQLEPASTPPRSTGFGPVSYVQLCLLAAFGLLLAELLVPPGRHPNSLS